MQLTEVILPKTSNLGHPLPYEDEIRSVEGHVLLPRQLEVVL